MKLFPNQEYLTKKFPKMSYAFISNYIIKSHDKRRFKLSIKEEKQTLDMIFVVDDAVAWNKENFALNKNHYPLISKILSYRVINFFQKRGAKIHFNSFIDETGQVQ